VTGPGKKQTGEREMPDYVLNVATDEKKKRKSGSLLPPIKSNPTLREGGKKKGRGSQSGGLRKRKRGERGYFLPAKRGESGLSLQSPSWGSVLGKGKEGKIPLRISTEEPEAEKEGEKKRAEVSQMGVGGGPQKKKKKKKKRERNSRNRRLSYVIKRQQRREERRVPPGIFKTYPEVEPMEGKREGENFLFSLMHGRRKKARKKEGFKEVSICTLWGKKERKRRGGEGVFQTFLGLRGRKGGREANIFLPISGQKGGKDLEFFIIASRFRTERGKREHE